MGEGKLKEVLELRAAEDEAILRSIGEGLIVADSDNCVVMINEVAASLLGWGTLEAIGKKVSEVAPVEKEETVGISILALSSEAMNKGGGYYLVRKNGTRFQAEITTSAIILERKMVGAVIVFCDRTIEKAAERAQSDFIAISSHQLRTPLGSMKWNLEMLLSGEFGSLGEKAATVVKRVLESNERMIVLVNDLLSVSRIEQHRIPDRPEFTDLVLVIDKAIKDIAALASVRGVQISLTQGDFVPKIYLDPTRFLELVQNLLSNAVKYNVENGSVKVTVRKVDDSVLVSVADSGIGISAVDQKRLFQVFFRSDEAIKNETEGTGLGLYVVRSYVESWGGKTWCESEVGHGSTFFVEIPMEQNGLTKQARTG